jgi:hypothetical protein
MITENTKRLAALLSDASARDNMMVWIDSDPNKCCVHPGGNEVYAISCSKRMALHIVDKYRLPFERMEGGFLYSA